MDLVSLFLFVISTIGMCLIIVDGSIMEEFRALVKKLANFIKIPTLGGVVDCYLCCGTWCGFFMGYTWISHEPLKIFACGCAGAFISNLAAAVLNWVEAATIINLPRNNDGN